MELVKFSIDDVKTILAGFIVAGLNIPDVVIIINIDNFYLQFYYIYYDKYYNK